MRILIAHNCYQQTGGEDAVVANETALLESYGHEVFPYIVSNDSIKGLVRSVGTALQVHYSQWGRGEAAKIIEESVPDVVHVHNFFPRITPAIYDACREAGVPVVQTLHNYRTICASALLMRAGRPCEDCVKGSPYQAVLHRCYRDSRLGSLAVARMVQYHRKRGTWSSKVDRFIALTQFAKEKFVDAGLPEEKIVIKPNFVRFGKGVMAKSPEREGALYVGRVSVEKGVRILLKSFSLTNGNSRLRLIGEGPLLDEVIVSNHPRIDVLRGQNPQRVASEMARAAYLIMPSICYETFGMVLIEAFANGLPVIASNLGVMAEIVEDGVTGILFDAGNADDLSSKLDWATANPKAMRQMGDNARLVYEQKYTAEKNYQQLISIYRDVVEGKKLELAPV